MVTVARRRAVAARGELDVVAIGLCALALALALVDPAAVVLVAPIVFGVPHVASDLRYLVVRGPLRAAALAAVVVPLALLVGQRAMLIAGGAFFVRAELAFGFAAIVGAVMFAPDRGGRRAVILALAAGLAVAALAWPRAATVVVMHAHNLVGIGLWLAWTGGDRGRRWPVIAVAAVALAAIGVGACDPIASGLADLGATLAPGLTPVAAGRVALAFAFLQTLHYVAWLYLVPRALGVRGVVRDLGRAGVALLAVAAVAVPVAAALGDAAHIRSLYLSAVIFHAWLELAVAGYLLAS